MYVDELDGEYMFARSKPREELFRLLQLWASVLLLGIEDFAAAPEMRTKYAREIHTVNRKDAARLRASYLEAYRVERWLLSDSNHVGSFVWICHLLGLDPEVVRMRAIEMRAEGRNQRRRWRELFAL